MQTNVNLSITAKGKDMKFKWLKHGDHSDDDMTISMIDERYHMTESVLEIVISAFFVLPPCHFVHP